MIGFEARWVYYENTINNALSVISDGRTHCQRLSATMVDVWQRKGFVAAEGNTGDLGKNAEVKWETCRQAVSYITSDKTAPALDEIIAIHVLSHEAVHMNNIWDESQTECEAIQWDSVIAQRLGATKEQGDALATRYWEEYYPRMPDNYRSSDCQEGGKMDLNPEADEEWPNGRTKNIE